MLEELKIASENKAMQHLANLTGKRIKIAETMALTRNFIVGSGSKEVNVVIEKKFGRYQTLPFSLISEFKGRIESEINKVKKALPEFETYYGLDPEDQEVGVHVIGGDPLISQELFIKFETEEQARHITEVLEGMEYSKRKVGGKE